VPTSYVVTEHGIANLFGKNLRQRAEALIGIAAPSSATSRARQGEEAPAVGRIEASGLACLSLIASPAGGGADTARSARQGALLGQHRARRWHERASAGRGAGGAGAAGLPAAGDGHGSGGARRPARRCGGRQPALAGAARDRRRWVEELRAAEADLGLATDLVLYRNVRTNNGDLPPSAWLHGGGPLPASADELDPAGQVPFPELFARRSILLAPTEFSATAPLKVAARSFPIRAATMPGFSTAMIPALRLDYGEVNRRVALLAGLLERAAGCDLLFRHPGGEAALHLDLRHRPAHASGGSSRSPASPATCRRGGLHRPVRGERPGEPSRSAGLLPVQLGDEVVLYRVEENRASRSPPAARPPRRRPSGWRREPAYGNLAELASASSRRSG